jgi:radical SAM protein with 4Fe4S-binding SPASM domain
VSVFSNGTLITGEIIDLFRRYPPRVVEVPVYGAGPEVHDAVTAVPGSFARVDANIRRMLHAGVKVGLKTVLMQNNARHVEAIEAYAEALSVPFRVDPLLFHPFGKDPERVESLRLTAEESVRLELGSVRRREQWLAYASPRSEWPPPERLYTCGAGVTSFHIDAEGGLSPCLMSTYERVDLRKVSFGEAWEVLASFARRPAPELYPCRQCDVHVYCTGCAAMNRLENGDETKVAEYVCDMAKVRAGMLNLPSTEQGYRYEKQRG